MSGVRKAKPGPPTPDIGHRRQMKGALFTNGRFHTFDPDLPEVQAIAVLEGRIVARGATADLRDAFPGYSRIDLTGRPVFPGFIDSHIHFASYGISLTQVELRDARSLRDAVERVAAAVEHTRPGEWVRGRGWDKNVWPEGRFPTRHDLDPISPANPVILASKDGHLVWVNSMALRQAGIDGKKPNPPGGEIARDSHGEPTGVLKEQAKDLIWNTVPAEGPQMIEDGIRRATEQVHRLGLTGVHNFVGAGHEGAHEFAAFQRLQARDQLRLRVWMAVPERNLEAAVAAGLRTGFGNEWLRLGPVKIFADGTLGSQTASMLEPFEGQPQNTGIAIHTPQELIDLVGRAVAGGFWCAIHAIGDRANRWVLDAYEAHRDASQRLGARHRIEHVQLLHPDDLMRPARLGIVASMQPIHATSDRDLAERYWGRRSRYAYAWRSLLTKATRLVFGSDAPVETPDVFQGLYAAVTRMRADEPSGAAWYPEESLTVPEALKAYTIGAAYASGEETAKAMLAEGKLADFVVLDREILAVPPGELLQTRVETTVIGGEIVYAAPSFSG